MRASEFLTEYDAFNKGSYIQKQILGKYILKARAKEKSNGSIVLLITVYDPKNPKTGMLSKEFEQFGFDGIATFRFIKKKDGSVVSADSAVDKDYQRQGIASEVYKFVSKLGYDVSPSSMLTPQGKEMWRGFKDKGVLKELGDKPYVLPKRWVEGEKTITLPSGKELKITIENSSDVAIVNFYVDETQDITGQGDAFKIFSTVSNAVFDYVKKKKPEYLVFTGNSSHPSRIKLYDRIVAKWLQNPVFRSYEDLTNDKEIWPDDLEDIVDEIQDIQHQKLYVLARYM